MMSIKVAVPDIFEEAAARMPEGYEICIAIEKGSGIVYWTDSAFEKHYIEFEDGCMNDQFLRALSECTAHNNLRIAPV